MLHHLENDPVHHLMVLFTDPILVWAVGSSIICQDVVRASKHLVYPLSKQGFDDTVRSLVRDDISLSESGKSVNNVQDYNVEFWLYFKIHSDGFIYLITHGW